MAVQTDDTGSTRVGFDDDDDKRFELVSTKQTKIEVEFEITEVTTSDKSAEPGGPTLNEVKTMMENTRWALVRERMLSPKSRRPSKMAAVVAAAMQAEKARKQRKMRRLSHFIRDASASAMVSAKLLTRSAFADLIAKLVHIRRQGHLNEAESKMLLTELEALEAPTTEAPRHDENQVVNHVNSLVDEADQLRKVAGALRRRNVSALFAGSPTSVGEAGSQWGIFHESDRWDSALDRDARAFCERRDVALLNQASSPRVVRAALEKTDVQAHLDLLRDSVRGYAKALAHDPDNTRAHYGKGVALRKLGLHDAAIAALDRAVAIDGPEDFGSHSGAARDHLARALSERGARADVERAIAIMSGLAGGASADEEVAEHVKMLEAQLKRIDARANSASPFDNIVRRTQTAGDVLHGRGIRQQDVRFALTTRSDVPAAVLWLERGGRSPIGRLSQLAKTLYNLQALVAVVDVVAFAYGAHLPAGEKHDNWSTRAARASELSWTVNIVLVSVLLLCSCSRANRAAEPEMAPMLAIMLAKRVAILPSVFGAASAAIFAPMPPALARRVASAKKRVIFQFVRNPVRMAALVQRLLVVVRWAQWGIPLVGACNKLRGEMRHYLQRRRAAREKKAAMGVISWMQKQADTHRTFIKAVTAIQATTRARRAMKRVAATCFVSGARHLNDDEMRAAVADMIARQYRKKLHRAREALRARARANGEHEPEPKFLFPPNSAFAARWKMLKLATVAVEILQLLLRARGSAAKLAEEDLAHLLMPPSCRPLPPVIAPRHWWQHGAAARAAHRATVAAAVEAARFVVPPTCAWATGARAFLHWVPWLLKTFVVLVCTLDVPVNFFAGDLNSANGTLQPKPTVARWVVPGVALQLAVNPAMRHAKRAIAALVAAASRAHLTPERVLHWLLWLEPLVIALEVYIFVHVRRFLREHPFLSKREPTHWSHAT